MRNDRNGICSTIKELLFPRRCPICDDIVPIGEGKICFECKKRIKYIKEPRCRKCGKQLLDNNQMFCMDCASRKHYFEQGYALYDYQSVKKGIYRFKYKNRCEYADFYAEDIYKYLKNEIIAIGADAIIPVPIHASKFRERGYNQAELIAKGLSDYTQIPMNTKLVTRIKKTVPQKELDILGRQNNLKKAFNISSDVVKLNKTILIDDIYTTGSTLDSIALELKKHGVKEVYFIALCIGEGI